MERTALVTGCSSGIGRATARAFSDEGWTVYATAREDADLAGLDTETATLDVTSDDDVERVVDRVIEETGRIDCLVNNAGYGQYGPLEDVTADRLTDQLDVNVVGPHRLVRAVLPHMRAAEEGTIVNVSSVAGRVAPPGAGAYAASKFALEGYSDTLRNEVAGLGIDVALVEPGPVETPFRDRVEQELDTLARTDDYEWVYEMQEDAGLLSGSESPFASTPEEVAATILEAGVSTNPNARYAVGGFAKALLLGRFLPDGLRDRASALFRKL
ncbi:SDR family NAD(P)-dependent oxidoreductase [Halosegnis longus]|uniref:SDR family NAD(P)-dependent oxidoreductase n=1 Tax=Halosegnis longus TaxID=2216012 RepID=UPI00096A3CD4|nr:SDR family oxidoreductase [Salella cibi]